MSGSIHSGEARCRKLLRHPRRPPAFAPDTSPIPASLDYAPAQNRPLAREDTDVNGARFGVGVGKRVQARPSPSNPENLAPTLPRLGGSEKLIARYVPRSSSEIAEADAPHPVWCSSG